MQTFSFDGRVAKTVGVEAAVLFDEICNVIEQNKATDANKFAGRYWAEFSVQQFVKMIPFLTDFQVVRALDDLNDAGLIRSIDYRWHTIPEGARKCLLSE